MGRVSNLSPVSPREYRLVDYSRGTRVNNLCAQKVVVILEQMKVKLLTFRAKTTVSPIVIGGGQINFRETTNIINKFKQNIFN